MSNESGSYKGVIKCFFQDKGYGFIKPEDGSKDVFFHKSAVTDQSMMREGTAVTFSVKKDVKGRKAENIKLAD